LWRKCRAAAARTTGGFSRSPPFIQRLARTFADYTEGIRAYWKHRSSSGTQEGLNHQIKTMLRQTFDLRGEGCCMLRLHALHQAHSKFIG
jgi:transposase